MNIADCNVNKNNITHFNQNEWIEVNKKQRGKKTSSIKREIITREDAIHKLKFLSSCVEYNIQSVLLFGSTATGKQTESSDIDVMIIWKHLPKKLESLDELKNKIVKIFNGKKVDLISMEFVDRLVLDLDTMTDSRACFLQNVLVEAIPIYGSVDDIKFSLYISKN